MERLFGFLSTKLVDARVLVVKILVVVKKQNWAAPSAEAFSLLSTTQENQISLEREREKKQKMQRLRLSLLLKEIGKKLFCKKKKKTKRERREKKNMQSLRLTVMYQ